MIKIAFIHKPDHPYLTGKYFSSQSYRFYIKGLMKNDRIKVYPINTIDQIKNDNFKKYDIILFVGLKMNRDIDPSFAKRIKDINKPKIACSYDCHKFDAETLPLAKIAGVKNFFYHHNKEWFYEFAPKEYNYRQIFMCLDESLVEKVLSWKYRQRDKILVTGAMNDTQYYTLRKKCAELPYTWYVDRREHFIADRFVFLLQGFRATVAACDVVTVNKYLESMACGTLTFAQANNINHWENLELIDGENSILINDSNYKDKMLEYVNNLNNPKWQKIAQAGREHVLSKFGLKKQVDKFVDYIEELI